MKNKANDNFYTLQFWLLGISSFLFFLSFNMIIPELPAYLTSIGGGDYKGLIIALFTVTAGLSRPFSGKLSDTIGRIPVMVFGAGVCFFVAMAYPILNTVVGFFVLRFLHGFSTGFKPTGTTAYVADIVPEHRRGEAMGVIGVFGSSLGMAAGNAISSPIKEAFSIETLFYTSGVIAILSVLILAGMKETLPKPQKFRWALLKVNHQDFFEPRVLHPSIVMMCTVFSFGAVLTIMPDFSEHLGKSNKGAFFSFLTLSSLVLRLVTGKLSDKFGRVAMLRVSTICSAIAMAYLGMVTTADGLMWGAILLGIGYGMNTPVLFAWTIDLSHEAHRGRAMSTVFIALEMGIGTGALASGWLYGNQAANFPITFWVSGAFCVLAFLYLCFVVPNYQNKPQN